MYARLRKGTAFGVDGASEVFTLHRLAGFDDLVVSLWPTREEAAADPAAEWYQVEGDHPGGSRAEAPRIVAMVCFDGPLSEPRRRATRRASSERIAPRMAGHQGSVRALELWQPERRTMLVMVLALSVEAIEDGQRVVQSTELLPGEDPALLPGPDRVDLYRAQRTDVFSGAASHP